MLNNYHGGVTKRHPAVMKKWINTKMLHFMPNLVDNYGRIILNENFLSSQFLSYTNDARSSSTKLYTEDSRLKEL